MSFNVDVLVLVAAREVDLAAAMVSTPLAASIAIRLFVQDRKIEFERVDNVVLPLVRSSGVSIDITEVRSSRPTSCVSTLGFDHGLNLFIQAVRQVRQRPARASHDLIVRGEDQILK
jgi:hypothetical protein